MQKEIIHLYNILRCELEFSPKTTMRDNITHNVFKDKAQFAHIMPGTTRL